MLYADYKALESSEKIALVVVEASKRLMGWALYSGSIYSLSGDYAVVTSLSVSGVDLVEVEDIGSVTAGKFYNDRTNKIIYMRSSGSVNPNGLFTHIKFKMFFSNNGVKLAHDLSSGFEVEWLPMVKSTSEFGVAIDNQNQLGMALEGSGNVAFYNDQSFWAPRYDKLYFENQRVWVYSWNRKLPASQAKIIFKGRIQSKSWTPDQVTFQIKDELNELRAPISLANIGDLANVKVPESLLLAKQRRVYGYLNGHVCTNIDQVVDGYPFAYPLTFTEGSKTVTGSVDPAFLTDLRVGDEIWITSTDIRYTVESISSDSSLTISEAYVEDTVTDYAYFVPARQRYNVNRVYSICGHELPQLQTTVLVGYGLSLFDVADAGNITSGDIIGVGDGYHEVDFVSGNRIKLKTNLLNTPIYGDDVIRYPVQKAYFNKKEITLGVDFTASPTTGKLTLEPSCEFNLAPVNFLNGTVTFTNGSKSVTGSGTAFSSDLKVGDWIRANGEADYFEVAAITSNTALSLASSSTYSHTTSCYFKSPEYANEDTVISCDLIGITDDGTWTGNLISTAPEIVRHIIEDVGLTVNGTSFDTCINLAEQHIGLAIPENFDDTETKSARDYINKINQSIFGVLYQNSDFELSYSMIQPTVPESRTILAEEDIIKFSVKSDSQRIIKTARVRYKPKEYDYLSGDRSQQEASKTSDSGQYLARTAKEFVQDTILVNESDAQAFANRWAFILENASSIVDIDTKLQGMELNINDTVELIHEKLYERIGSPLGRKIALVHEVKKTAQDSSISIEDLSSAFSRVGSIVPNSANVFSDASDAARFSSSFITDSYGMIDNDDDSFGVNLIW